MAREYDTCELATTSLLVLQRICFNSLTYLLSKGPGGQNYFGLSYDYLCALRCATMTNYKYDSFAASPSAAVSRYALLTLDID
eukprot:4193410-Pleurochrysis_carterae.AAC.2